MHFFFPPILFVLSCILLAKSCKFRAIVYLRACSYPFQKSLNAYSRAKWLKRVNNLSMEELFAHNLHSEDKGLKKTNNRNSCSVCSLPGNKDRPHRVKSASIRLGRLHIWVSKPLLEKYLRTPLATLVRTNEEENREREIGGRKTRTKERHVVFLDPRVYFLPSLTSPSQH